MLIKINGDPLFPFYIPMQDGDTPFMMAKQYGHDDIVKILENADSKVHTKIDILLQAYVDCTLKS